MLHRACLVLASLIASRTADADVKLPALISDGMVLEQKTPLRIWGYASEGEKVTVSFRGQTAASVTKDGRWTVTLQPVDAGGPFEMTIAGNNIVKLANIAVGEVWLCSGQSNMEFGLADAQGGSQEVHGADDPMLRMFTVERKVAEAPQAEVAGGHWEIASPSTAGHFSAVGYYFARALRRARNVPVGMIHSSWGGTLAESWTSRSALEEWGLPSTAFKTIRHDPATASDYQRRVDAWKTAGSPDGPYEDPGIAPVAKAWALPQTDARDWRRIHVPGRWEDLGAAMEIDGAVWFRREIEIPAAWAGQDLELHLGAIDDYDTAYFNGVAVGATGVETPGFWEVRRQYVIPGRLVQSGRAVVAVRVWDHGGDGGFMGPEHAMWIAPKGKTAEFPRVLAGEWRYKVETSRPGDPRPPPELDPNLPAVLYNGMIAPLVPYVIKGAIWYQGESNAGLAYQYASLLSTMIRTWRSAWGVGPFPFLVVQLAPYMEISPQPEDSAWAELREAQQVVAHTVPNVGLAVITDAGDEKDIHPKNKQPAGERLALAARRIAYGERITSAGPTYRSMKVVGDKVTIRFDDVGKGLAVRGPKLTGFAVAGADKKFVWADAAVVGDTVVVSSPGVSTPAYVRFGWASYPVVNLWNQDGLPAVPFRTDKADR